MNGGYVAYSPCGCLLGWQAYLSSEEDIDVVIEWLRQGCTVKQVPEGTQIKRELCAQHAEVVHA